MEKIRIDEVNNKINKSKIIILYFSNTTCGACEVIREKLRDILKPYPEIQVIYINGEEEKEFAASKDVLTFPLLILYVDGKETIRVGRNVDLERNIKRYYEMLF